MKHFFIVNPVAGLGKGFLVWERIKKVLKEKGVNFDYAVTKYPRHAIKIAKEVVSSGYKSIISVGGDGTISEVTRGIEGEDVVIGIIPAGRGRDFPRALNIPKDPVEALDIILKEKRIIEVDHPRINNERFINVCGVGFDAEVARNANTKYRKFGGLSYLISLFNTMTSWKTPEVILKIDGVIRKIPVLFVVIANGIFYGGGMKISPNSLINDGFLNIIIFYKMSKLTLLTNFPKVYIGGKHIKHKKVEELRAKSVEIKSRENLYIQADGDIIGDVPVRFEMDGKKLKFFGG